MSLLKTMTALSLAATLSIGSALAADLSLYSDKTPWNAGMTGLADIASKASGATVKLQEITPSDKYLFLSATIVREIAVLGGDISAFVLATCGKQQQQQFNFVAIETIRNWCNR